MKIVLNSVLLLLLSGAVSAFAPAGLPTAKHTTKLYANKKIFIDGEAGTTGLQVRSRIEARNDLDIISAPDELRKDEATRKKLINEADAVILCKFNSGLRASTCTCRSLVSFVFFSGLPDAASIEASSWVEPDNDRTVLIDASTAFRVDPDWTYGFPGKSNIRSVCTSMF